LGHAVATEFRTQIIRRDEEDVGFLRGARRNTAKYRQASAGHQGRNFWFYFHCCVPCWVKPPGLMPSCPSALPLRRAFLDRKSGDDDGFS
jgi:hypothetical protein